MNFWLNLVKFGFRLLYHEMAWTYDMVSWLVSGGNWRAWQETGLPYVQGPQVLELGHGPGHMLLALQTAGHQAIGLDLSPQMGKLARKRTTAPLIRGRVQDLPLPTAVFNTVFSTFPTNYITDPVTLASVHRVLKENGRFIIIPEGHLSGNGPLARFIRWLYQITGQQPPQPPTTSDIWQPFRLHLEAAGFQVNIHTATLPNSEATIIIAQKAKPL